MPTCQPPRCRQNGATQGAGCPWAPLPSSPPPSTYYWLWHQAGTNRFFFVPIICNVIFFSPAKQICPPKKNVWKKKIFFFVLKALVHQEAGFLGVDNRQTTDRHCNIANSMKLKGKGTSDIRHTDIADTRLNRLRGRFSERGCLKKGRNEETGLHIMALIYLVWH